MTARRRSRVEDRPNPADWSDDTPMRPRGSKLARTIRDLKALGLSVSSVEILPDGGFKVLTNGGAETADAAFERLEAERLARKAARAAHRN